MGWEIKNFGVKNFDRLNSKVITLMTPEPNGGLYVTQGREKFILDYGYADKSGRADRLNVGGVHKVGTRQSLTNLELQLIGYDAEAGKIRHTDGRVALIDSLGNEAASWSFSSMLYHWNKKHNQACFVPSLSQKFPEQKYKYCNRVILGEGTDFLLFLEQMSLGNIYYDPGIKMENISRKPKIKPRSQFRIKSRFLPAIYKTNAVIDLPWKEK